MDNFLPNVLQETYGLRPQGKKDPMMAKKAAPGTAAGVGLDPSSKAGPYKAPVNNLKAAGLSSGAFANDNFFDGFVQKSTSREKKRNVSPASSSKEDAVLGKASSKVGLDTSQSNKSSSDSLFDDANSSGKNFAATSTPASAFDDLLGGSTYHPKNSLREDTNGVFDSFNHPNTDGTPGKSSKTNSADPFNAFDDHSFFDSSSPSTNSKQDDLDQSHSGPNKSSSKPQSVPRTYSFERSTKSSQAKSRQPAVDSPKSSSKPTRSNPPSRSSSTDEGSRGFSQVKSSPKGKDPLPDRWLTVEEIILQTQPHPTPPSRPPPPLSFPKSGSKPEMTRTYSKPLFPEPEKPELSRNYSKPASFTEPEFSPFGFENGVPPPMPPLVKPIPPLVRPSSSSKLPSQSHGEDPLFGFDDEPFTVKKAPFQPESVASPSKNSFKGFENPPAADRQRTPEPTMPSPVNSNAQRTPPFSSYSFVPPTGSMRESPFVPNVETNDSAMAAEKSSSAMKEVLERAQRRVEKEREKQEKERQEKERQEKEIEKQEREKQRAERERVEREKAAREKERKEKEQAAAYAAAREAAAPRSYSNPNAPNPPQYDFFNNPNPGFGEEWKPQGPVNLDDLGKPSQNHSAPTDDWMNVLGGVNVAPPDAFQEIPGESEERRKLRYERHVRLKERAAAALDEKNKRDMILQKEQEDRHRAAEILDMEIKMWAQGKEGNIRALLSTLQYVLWPECKWEPISLTEIITGAAVKKAYRKATLCLHPDKVQQRGASVQQKYIAEKVFDLLKEAWNKFNQEELF